MKFILLERIEGVPVEFYSEWSSADDKRRELIVRELLQALGMNDTERKTLLSYVDSFRNSCDKFGIDEKENPFINYIQQFAKANGQGNKYDSYVNELVRLADSGDLSTERVEEVVSGKDNYLSSTSLFQRNLKDFEYTIKIFETVLTPFLLKKYFKDTSKISEKDLWENGQIGGRIKPAGSEQDADNTNTIYGVVEMWSDGGANDQEVSSKRKDDKVDYSVRYLTKIKQTKHYSSIDAIPKEENREGNIVYVYFKDDMVKGGIDDDNWVDTWMQYNNGKWGVYKP